MSKHTPEPWIVTGSERVRYIESRIGGGMLQEIASLMSCEVGDVNANATRITSCVNACAGMRDPEKYIEKMREKIERLDKFAADRCDRVDALWREMCAAEEQRDKLLAALESLTEVAASCDGWESFPRCALDAANSAIAEASK